MICIKNLVKEKGIAASETFCGLAIYCTHVLLVILFAAGEVEWGITWENTRE